MMDKLKALVTKYRDVLVYLVVGGCTTLVNWVVYALLVKGAGFSVMAGNILSWVAAVLFAFFTNKIWVFRSRGWAAAKLAREFATFVGSRLFTGLLELGLVPLLVALGLSWPLFGIEGFAAKVLVGVIVVILNYILSKWLVFKGPQKKRTKR